MPIALTSLSPKAKTRYVEVGENYGSESTLAQADATLQALESYAAALASCGFGSRDVERLRAARDGLLAAGVLRAAARTGAAVARTAQDAAEGVGKQERANAKSVLAGARRDLFDAGGAEAEAAVRAIDAALQATPASVNTAVEFVNQLELLKSALSAPVVAAAAAERGGTEAVAALGQAASTIKASSAPIKRGTPAETATLNVYDGIIVELCRGARRAARVHAKKQGAPAVAKAFALTHLAPSPAQPAKPLPAPQT